MHKIGHRSGPSRSRDRFQKAAIPCAVANHDRGFDSHHLLQSPFESARAWLQSDTGFPAKNADLGATAGFDLIPLFVEGTTNVILSANEGPSRKRWPRTLVADVLLGQ